MQTNRDEQCKDNSYGGVVMTVGFGYFILTAIVAFLGKFHDVFNPMVVKFGLEPYSESMGFAWNFTAFLVGWVYAVAVMFVIILASRINSR
ncbi:hypothetical protein E0765_07465 [Sulfuricurvum sp. IAE1]|uniref:hypothetical protein n=1 Tax=Sulfuricurvum sp. IAE1 TaxID=2546102 RepID=UPI001050304B|nr:hypothetical protein [Sulfuricurvum sp. IAE1]TDA63665.1 hypothetical protein E0765_07465 [Sulfuricurvum sp. IAE1]